MEMLDLTCKKCNGQLRPEDTDNDLHILRCRHCNAFFAIKRKSSAQPEAPKQSERLRVEMPSKFDVQRTTDTLTMTWKWIGFGAWLLLVFSIAWNAFMVVWHSIALSKGVWFMSLFGLLHTFVGLFLIYQTAAMFLNSTNIKVTKGVITVRSGPLPMPNCNHLLLVDDISQLYCFEKISRTNNSTSRTYNNSTSRTYEVRAVRTGRNVKLVTGLQRPEQAVYIEQEIEDFLGIEDQPIRGEYII